MRLFLGRPLATSEQKEQKIGVLAGIPALGLDGLSSSAYGPEAALTILIPLGAAGLHYVGPITLIIVALLAILYVSYRQTIAAYPINGGSYTVAKENLGFWAGLLAAAALMIDYILNVAVGISAGVAALVSAIPALHHYTLLLCLAILALITLVNLRGTAEAGLAFSIPTYLFIASLLLVLVMGAMRTLHAGGHPQPRVAPPAIPAATQAAGIWILLRSFASGCAAMTGIEAVSNGVNVFKEPSVRHAHRTLTGIVIILALLLVGIAYLSRAFGLGAMDQSQSGYQSVLSQLIAAVAGRGWFYYIAIASVLAVLCLSANTSFVGFPRLCRLIAKDDFLPRPFAVVGRRLVYSIGILFLAGSAGLLLAAFRGITDRLIPLFAVGAFFAFTMSQAGMVVHWRRTLAQHPGRHAHIAIWVNGIGALATAAALAIILAAKFLSGAWIVLVAFPVLLGLFKFVHRHYVRLERQVADAAPLDLPDVDPPIVLLPIRRWDKLTAKSLRFAMHVSPDVIAVHLSNLSGEAAGDQATRVRQEWAADVEEPARRAGLAEPKLVMVQTPYRRFVEPLLRQIDRLKSSSPDRDIAVIVPELVPRHWWQVFLHRHKAAGLRKTLRKRGDWRIVVITVPWYLDE
jgi:amino acid transporter